MEEHLLAKAGQSRVGMVTLIHPFPQSSGTEAVALSQDGGWGWARKAGSSEGALSSEEGGKKGFWQLRRKARAT